MTDDSRSAALLSRQLRQTLRQARVQAGYTQEQVATSLEVSHSKVARMETGVVGISAADLMAMADLYHITDREQIGELADMARATRQRRWWSSYSKELSERYKQFVEYEQAASGSSYFQSLNVPGIVQTRPYAEAIITVFNSDGPAERIERLVDFRLRRQHLLDEESPPSLTLVLEESVLRMGVGDGATMHGQFEHLIDLAERPNVSVQVYPFSSGMADGMQAPFVLHSFADGDDDVLYFEQARGDSLIDGDPHEVMRYEKLFLELRRRSLSQSDSIRFLKERAAEFSKSF